MITINPFDRMVEYALDSSDRARLPYQQYSDDELSEKIIKKHLEELNFSFGEDSFDDLTGFMISESGYRRIVTYKNLRSAERIYMYFHLLGHVANGDVSEEDLTVIKEFADRSKLNTGEKVKEYRADK